MRTKSAITYRDEMFADKKNVVMGSPTPVATASAPRGSGAGARATVLAALVFLVAFNLRTPLTGVGPLLPEIGPDLSLSESAQGLLGSLPLLAFSLISPLAAFFARKLGMEQSVFLSLILMAAGTLLRSYGGLTGLWAGAFIAGASVAVGNVLVPSLVKRDYSQHLSMATAIYSTVVSLSAAVGSVAAVPLSNMWGWRAALAVWAIPALISAALWTLRLRQRASDVNAQGADREPADLPLSQPVATKPLNVWKQPVAWMMTGYMGLQSCSYYLLSTWLPTIEINNGVSAETAGFHLFIFQMIGVFSGLAIPRLMKGPTQVTAAVLGSGMIFVSTLGLLFLPQLVVVSAFLAGLGSGITFVVALTMISMRGRTPQEAAQLSGMAQSVGYVLAATGPLLSGALAEWTGNWTATLIFLVLIALANLVISFPAGRSKPLGS